MILHFDADAFFASVEQAADTKLRGRPAAVGGERRGIIASASYEARKLGINTPMPTARARKLCPQLDCVPCDFEKYSPRSHTQGRAGESSPALLCLGFVLNALYFWKGEADAAAEHGCFDFTRFAPAAQRHGSDFPACGQISGGEEGRSRIGVGKVFHDDAEYSLNPPNVTNANSTLGLTLKNLSAFVLCCEADHDGRCRHTPTIKLPLLCADFHPEEAGVFTIDLCGVGHGRRFDFSIVADGDGGVCCSLPEG